MDTFSTISLELGLSFLLRGLRLLPIIFLVPAFGGEHLPRVSRVMIAVVLIIGVLPSVPTSIVAGSDLVVVAVKELLVGSLFGLAIAGLFLAGDALARVVQLTQPRPTPLLTSVQQLVFVCVFFLSGTHRRVIRASIESYTVIPLAKVPDQQWFVAGLLQIGGLFALALSFVAPLLSILLVLIALEAAFRRVLESPQQRLLGDGVYSWTLIAAFTGSLPFVVGLFGDAVTELVATFFNGS